MKITAMIRSVNVGIEALERVDSSVNLAALLPAIGERANAILVMP